MESLCVQWSLLTLLFFKQFVYVRTSVWENGAKTAAERAVANRNEHDGENCSASATVWP